ncbi:ATP-binding cassette domain-containing protein [Fluviispira multicolorata]|uniref:ATP-binding cassette domain-containing protein n=1 Tax=Fluviispira multicolorata TaxID=2654512 RepID=A0A833JCW3_9BACT|nr:ATP-binding cassette domain-containing protein [Fluviispira multicolorata]KAB8030948.1 ATP-binding cassette domain-containing protein [Fluviispira multicolorata]
MSAFVFKAEKIFYSTPNHNILLKDINFEYNEGDIVCLLGNNGAGKSTLIKICAGILSASFGNILINKNNIKCIGKTQQSQLISWLPQSLYRAENFNVIEFLSLNSLRVSKNMQKSNSELPFDFSNALRDFDILDQAKKELILLSGGEWKRVQLARLWLRKAKILFLDEPDGDLDLKHKINLVGKCKEYAQKNKAIIFITSHDIHFAKMVANKICALNNGIFVWNSEADIFWSLNILQKLYGLNKNDENHFYSK